VTCAAQFGLNLSKTRRQDFNRVWKKPVDEREGVPAIVVAVVCGQVFVQNLQFCFKIKKDDRGPGEAISPFQKSCYPMDTECVTGGNIGGFEGGFVPTSCGWCNIM
jgi:hypothetical protein